MLGFDGGEGEAEFGGIYLIEEFPGESFGLRGGEADGVDVAESIAPEFLRGGEAEEEFGGSAVFFPVGFIVGGDEFFVDGKAGGGVPVGHAGGVGEAFVVGGEGGVCAEAGHGEDFGEGEGGWGLGFDQFTVGLAFEPGEEKVVAELGIEFLGGVLIESDLVVF